jgi:hypothetical protein
VRRDRRAGGASGTDDRRRGGRVCPREYGISSYTPACKDRDATCDFTTYRVRAHNSFDGAVTHPQRSKELPMNTFRHALMGTCLALAASGAFAQDAMKKDMPMKDMTMADCKKMMEMDKKETTKQEDAVMMSKRQQCTDMMKKDGMKDSMKDGMKDPMKK